MLRCSAIGVGCGESAVTERGPIPFAGMQAKLPENVAEDRGKPGQDGRDVFSNKSDADSAHGLRNGPSVDFGFSRFKAHPEWRSVWVDLFHQGDGDAEGTPPGFKVREAPHDEVAAVLRDADGGSKVRAEFVKLIIGPFRRRDEAAFGFPQRASDTTATIEECSIDAGTRAGVTVDTGRKHHEPEPILEIVRAVK